MDDKFVNWEHVYDVDTEGQSVGNRGDNEIRDRGDEVDPIFLLRVMIIILIRMRRNMV